MICCSRRPSRLSCSSMDYTSRAAQGDAACALAALKGPMRTWNSGLVLARASARPNLPKPVN